MLRRPAIGSRPTKLKEHRRRCASNGKLLLGSPAISGGGGWMVGWWKQGLFRVGMRLFFPPATNAIERERRQKWEETKGNRGEKSGEKQEGAGFDVTAAKQTLCGLDRGWRRETGVFKNSESTSPRVSFILLLWIDRFVTCLHQWLWLYFFPPFIPERR